MQDIGLSSNQSIFIHTRLCPNYRMVWSKYKRLHELSNITSFYISSGTIKIKITENSCPIAMTHTQDFKLSVLLQKFARQVPFSESPYNTETTVPEADLELLQQLRWNALPQSAPSWMLQQP